MKLGYDAAIALAETGWWKGMPAVKVAATLLQIDEMVMDLDDMYRVLHEAFNRPVYTHELIRPDLLLQELLGERPAPTFAEIVALIPPEKRLVLEVDHESRT